MLTSGPVTHRHLHSQDTLLQFAGSQICIHLRISEHKVTIRILKYTEYQGFLFGLAWTSPTTR